MEKPISSKKVTFTLLDPTAIDIKEDSNGFFFMVGDYRADIPPHFMAKNFVENEALSFFIDKLGDVGVGLVVCYLCDLLKKQKIKDVNIEGNCVNTEEEIRKAIKDE